MLLRFFRTPAFTEQAVHRILTEAQRRLGTGDLESLATELCFSVGVSREPTSEELAVLRWLLAETFAPECFSTESFLADFPTVLEVGPRLTFETAYSSNAVAICHRCNLGMVTRIELSRRFGLTSILTDHEAERFLEPLFDRMTEERYLTPLTSFTTHTRPEPTKVIRLLEEGPRALREANNQLGLAMDEQDQDIWFHLFVNILRRNPTVPEALGIGQGNSEHSRHGFFKGIQIIDGTVMPDSLMDIVKAPWRARPGNSVIAFADNSSAQRGQRVSLFVPRAAHGPGPYVLQSGILVHPTLTAETHNHPSGIEPFQGATTGTGGRIRDNQMVGRGGLPIVAGAGYCAAHLHIPGYPLPWEEDCWIHPANLASPLEILIQASNGASFYGNCFGEPVVYGFVRTFEQEVGGERYGWFKPIMYSVGAGMVRDEHVTKDEPSKGMLVVLLGGPGYRIGVGGGSASSMILGSNVAELDFASVQRGDPEMENRGDRVVRACVYLGDRNPIRSAHDLGAGGVCNAVPEIVNPAGARISLRAIPVGDASLSDAEIWSNESQERNVVLVQPDDLQLLERICARERCPLAVIGEITGDGQLVVVDEANGTTPVNLPLDRVLGRLPQKTFRHERIERTAAPLTLPNGITVRECLNHVLRLPSVASKRWLTVKVDRSVTGLVAQQQCVGPYQAPVADFAIRADSHFGLTGSAQSLGEQPITGFLNPKAMGRLAFSEALLNLCGAKITALQDIRCSGNWMWAGKLAGEGPRLHDAACAARDLMLSLGIAIDGGKDSLSMAAQGVIGRDGRRHTVKAPGEFVVAAYASMPDITVKATPDLKTSGNLLVLVEMGSGKCRLGGSALAQVFSQLGDETPDVDYPPQLKRTFEGIQELLTRGLVESLHDRSDGGLIVTLLEMAFAGNVGLTVDVTSDANAIPLLFSEEPGVVLEIEERNMPTVQSLLVGVPNVEIGNVGEVGGTISVRVNGQTVLDEPMVHWRNVWEETSTQLDRLQANPDCVEEERLAQRLTTIPPYRLTFTPTKTPIRTRAVRIPVAVAREEGMNGDREMAAALHLAGFEAWDVTMHDLLTGKATTGQFRGFIFSGGFTFRDVFGAGKGWAGVIRFNQELAKQFQAFRERSDTFSLGVCNGCQLMALLGWVPGFALPEEQQPRFIKNDSWRFESRFPTVRIEDSPSIMLRGMAGSTLGIWVAHGEGRLHVPDERVLDRIIRSHQAPLRFVDERGEPTAAYPFNPNRSPAGIAALCSEDGRHLAMMPHPERLFLLWQWPWLPREWHALPASPWLTMFQNAYTWCREVTTKR